jgi:alpha-beta hydrolase superfamily lysophospholipase
VSDPVTQVSVRQLNASDGYPLHYRHYPPQATPPRGYIVALHGIQSHGGWYEYSSARLAEAGYEVTFLDRRGSGLNEQDRGHAPHADRLVNDVAQLLSDACFRRNRDAPNASVVLSGVSWGGKLAAITCARRPDLVDALLLSAPGICARVRPSWHQRWRLRMAMAAGIHRKLVPIPLDDPALFTGDRDWQDFIRNDKLSLRQATVSLLQASVELDAEVQTTPEAIACPTLMLLAGRDQIIDNHRSRDWFGRLPPSAGKLVEYPDARHTLEFEPNRNEIVDDTINWLESIERLRAPLAV